MKIFVVLCSLIISACAGPQPYRVPTMVGAQSKMDCTTEMTSRDGVDVRCFGSERLSKQDALEAVNQSHIANQSLRQTSLFGSLFEIRPSGHRATPGRWDRERSEPFRFNRTLRR